MIFETHHVVKTQTGQGKRAISEDELEQLKEISLSILDDIVQVCEEENIPYMLGGGTALGAIRHHGFIPWDDDIDINVPRCYISRLCEKIRQTYGEKYYVEVPLEAQGYLSSFVQVHKNGTIYREYLYQNEHQCGVKVDIFPIENTYNASLKRRIHGMRCEMGLFLLSCYRFFLWRKEYKGAFTERLIHKTMFSIKLVIGALVSVFGQALYKWVQNTLMECRDENSHYVVIPSGRRHFFGELYNREAYLATIEVEFAGRRAAVTKDYDTYLTGLYGDYMVIPKEQEKEHHFVYQFHGGNE